MVAHPVGETGTVYAVEIQPKMLAIIEQRAAAQRIRNVEPMLDHREMLGVPASFIQSNIFPTGIVCFTECGTEPLEASKGIFQLV